MLWLWLLILIIVPYRVKIIKEGPVVIIKFLIFTIVEKNYRDDFKQKHNAPNKIRITDFIKHYRRFKRFFKVVDMAIEIKTNEMLLVPLMTSYYLLKTSNKRIANSKLKISLSTETIINFKATYSCFLFNKEQ